MVTGDIYTTMNKYWNGCTSMDTAGTVTGDLYYYTTPTDYDYDAWKYLYPPPYNSGEQFNEAIKRLENKINKSTKGDDNMRFLYEVILVNPKDDEFEIFEIVAKTETSALMQAYIMSDFAGTEKLNEVEFDNLTTQCRVLMEWKKKERTTAVE